MHLRTLNEFLKDPLFWWRQNLKFEKFLAEEQPPKPLLRDGDCEEKELACGDGTCLPSHYFCDGSVDCPDGSDEGWCGKNNLPLKK